jgi:hypothetical protein
MGCSLYTYKQVLRPGWLLLPAGWLLLAGCCWLLRVHVRVRMHDGRMAVWPYGPARCASGTAAEARKGGESLLNCVQHCSGARRMTGQ